MRFHPWQGAIPPFRVLGNTWFTGLLQASTHLIDTGAGLILLDSGYQESLYYVLDGIYKCGFNPKDIKYIIHSHGHIDHAAAPKAISRLRDTGCRSGRFRIMAYIRNAVIPKWYWKLMLY